MLNGAVQLTFACLIPGRAVTVLGAVETVAGTNAFDAVESALVPIAFVADSLHTYVLPFVKPVTVVWVVSALTVTGLPAAGLAVTVKPVIWLPSSPPGVHDTVADPSPAEAFTCVGASGTVTGGSGVTSLLGAEGWPVPTPFVAVTVNV